MKLGNGGVGAPLFTILILKLSILCIFQNNVLNLLHQPNAQY